MRSQKIGPILSAVLGAGLLVGVANAQLSEAESEARQTQRASAASQKRITQLSDETARLVSDFRANLRQLEQSKKYNRSLERQIDSQDRQIQRLNSDIEALSGLQKAMIPHMESMLSSLRSLVSADMPFLRETRMARVERLEGLMDDPSQTAAQKYRLLVEAYQIELEYGQTIDAYTGSVDDGGTVYEGVDVFRVGRILLVYKTNDDQRMRVWNKNDKAWEDLDASFLSDVKNGIRMARELTPPDLLFMPVNPPVQAN